MTYLSHNLEVDGSKSVPRDHFCERSARFWLAKD
jgi:hypothetical protein